MIDYWFINSKTCFIHLKLKYFKIPIFFIIDCYHFNLIFVSVFESFGTTSSMSSVSLPFCPQLYRPKCHKVFVNHPLLTERVRDGVTIWGCSSDNAVLTRRFKAYTVDTSCAAFCLHSSQSPSQEIRVVVAKDRQSIESYRENTNSFA